MQDCEPRRIGVGAGTIDEAHDVEGPAATDIDGEIAKLLAPALKRLAYVMLDLRRRLLASIECADPRQAQLTGFADDIIAVQIILIVAVKEMDAKPIARIQQISVCGRGGVDYSVRHVRASSGSNGAEFACVLRKARRSRSRQKYGQNNGEDSW